jgi:RND superfamily putative drug exporter
MSGTDARVVAHAETGRVDEAALRAAVERLADNRGVSGVAPPLISPDGRTAVLAVQYDVPVTDFAGDDGVKDLEEAAAPLREAGLKVAFGGQVPENAQKPSGKAEAIGIAAAVIILFFAFGAVVAAGLPLAIAAIGLGVGTGGITLMAAFTDVSTVTPTLATMVGLGVGIDYALFIVTRHRDGLAEGLSVPEAAARANATAGQSVIFAGGTVLLAITGLQFAGVSTFVTMGYGTAIVVLITMIAAVTLLPALLGLAKLRVYSRKARRSGTLTAAASHSKSAARLADVVGRRPIPWLVGSMVVLLPSPPRRSACGSARATPEASRSRTPSARRTTSSPTASAPARTARSWSPPTCAPCRRTDSPRCATTWRRRPVSRPSARRRSRPTGRQRC